MVKIACTEPGNAFTGTGAFLECNTIVGLGLVAKFSFPLNSEPKIQKCFMLVELVPAGTRVNNWLSCMG